MAGKAASSPRPAQAITTPLATSVGGGTATSLTPLARRSDRFGVDVDGASVTDEDSMTKAMRRKATRNLDFSGMDSKSFLSFSPQSIHSKLSSVGFNLGNSQSQVHVY